MNFGAVTLKDIHIGEDFAIRYEGDIVHATVHNILPNVGRAKTQFYVLFESGGMAWVDLSVFVSTWERYTRRLEALRTYEFARQELTNRLDKVGIPFQLTPTPKTVLPEIVQVQFHVNAIIEAARESNMALDLTEIIRGLEKT